MLLFVYIHPIVRLLSSNKTTKINVLWSREESAWSWLTSSIGHPFHAPFSMNFSHHCIDLTHADASVVTKCIFSLWWPTSQSLCFLKFLPYFSSKDPPHLNLLLKVYLLWYHSDNLYTSIFLMDQRLIGSFMSLFC